MVKTVAIASNTSPNSQKALRRQHVTEVSILLYGNPFRWFKISLIVYKNLSVKGCNDKEAQEELQYILTHTLWHTSKQTPENGRHANDLRHVWSLNEHRSCTVSSKVWVEEIAWHGFIAQVRCISRFQKTKSHTGLGSNWLHVIWVI